jgi:hypothetical protein
MNKLKTRIDLLSDLRRLMDDFVGQTFTEEMRQRIRINATELMNTAYDEGQAAMAHCICANAGTKDCPQEEYREDYDEAVCRQCNLDGGFEI